MRRRSQKSIFTCGIYSKGGYEIRRLKTKNRVRRKSTDKESMNKDSFHKAKGLNENKRRFKEIQLPRAGSKKVD